MAIADIMAGDWAIFDDPRAVTFYPRATSSTFSAGASVTHAFRTAIDRNESADFGQLAEARCVWHLWTEKLGGIVPKVNDVIDDGTNRWMVETVKTADEGKRYRCECAKERA